MVGHGIPLSVPTVMKHQSRYRRLPLAPVTRALTESPLAAELKAMLRVLGLIACLLLAWVAIGMA
jgi:hypothetical protein